MRTRLALLAGLAALAGCQRRQATPPVQHTARYVVGPAWQGEHGAWFYPREQSSFEATGLAVVDSTQAGSVAADGELVDPAALTASVQTLPLPSVLRVRDLETGRMLFVRAINRGPGNPGRLLALSPAAAALLGIRKGQPAQVSVSLDSALSQQDVSALAGAPRLAISQAPVGAVTEQALGPPGSAAPAGPAAVQAAPSLDETPSQMASIPTGVQQGQPEPGALWLDGGRFDGRAAADTVAEALGGATRREGSGRQSVFRALAGPFRTVAEADAALDRARHAGVTGAHIIVE